MIEVICEMCGERYVPKNNRCNHRKYCDDCRKRANRMFYQKNKKQQEIIQSSCQKVNSRLDKKLKEISNYNEKHGTNYSYGQYTALKRLKKL